MAKSRRESGDDFLSQMSEGRMAQIVAQADGFDQIFVEPEGARYGARHLGDLEGVR